MITTIADRVMNGDYLSFAELTEFVSSLRAGKINDLQFVALLSAMETRNRIRGINLDEIANFIRAIRTPIKTDLEELLCPAGTGGDPVKTINISTPAGIVLASGGVKVLKNGYKSVTGSCGSRELLESFGINPFLDLPKVIQSVKQVGIGYYDFLNLITTDKRSGFRSPMNYIGALCHPFEIDYKIIGCSNEKQCELIEPIADRLYKRYILTFNREIDEISTVTPTEIVEKREKGKMRYSFDPQELGIQRSNYMELFSLQTPLDNARALIEVFEGKDSSVSQMIALNAGAGFYITGKAETLAAGYNIAREILLSGKAKRKLDEWVAFSSQNGENK